MLKSSLAYVLIMAVSQITPKHLFSTIVSESQESEDVVAWCFWLGGAVLRLQLSSCPGLQAF